MTVKRAFSLQQLQGLLTKARSAVATQGPKKLLMGGLRRTNEAINPLATLSKLKKLQASKGQRVGGIVDALVSAKRQVEGAAVPGRVETMTQQKADRLQGLLKRMTGRSLFFGDLPLHRKRYDAEAARLAKLSDLDIADLQAGKGGKPRVTKAMYEALMQRHQELFGPRAQQFDRMTGKADELKKKLEQMAQLRAERGVAASDELNQLRQMAKDRRDTYRQMDQSLRRRLRNQSLGVGGAGLLGLTSGAGGDSE